MPPPANGEATEQMIDRLMGAVRAHSGAAPFTLQRLAELLLEPQKQYSRLDKLVCSLRSPITLQTGSCVCCGGCGLFFCQGSKSSAGPEVPCWRARERLRWFLLLLVKSVLTPLHVL